MDRRQAIYAAVVLLLSVLVRIGECNCSRKYESTQPDCSTARLSDGQYTTTAIPCFVGSETTPLQQLEFPEHNTHTCYRTCINSDTNQCTATLLTNIHNRDLVIGSNFKLWVFSQGFLRTENQKYRRSSICRYNVKCTEGQILSYSIATHILEEPAQCGEASNACIDSLTLDFPGMATSHTSCGTRSATSTITDGSDEIHIEFLANRANELNGFLLLAWCVDPGIRESTTQRTARTVDSPPTDCTSPTPVWRRNSEWVEPTNDTALLKLANAFTEHSKQILNPQATHIIVNMFGHVRFNESIITITEHGEVTVGVFTNITYFHLSNRMVNNTVFNGSAPGKYHGYGYIVIWQNQAFFLQDGADPEYRPTAEEQEMIDELQLGIREAVMEKRLHLWRLQGEKGDIEVNGSGEAWSLEDKARLYSTACNALLRSVACAYLKLVHNEDCSEESPATDTVEWRQP